jgi:hypothetical protein
MELTYEQMKEREAKGRAMYQWWTLLSEQERQKIVKGIPGCLKFGLTQTNLPEAGKQALVNAYAEHLLWVESLEAAHPSE